jgi:hypothetical protein
MCCKPLAARTTTGPPPRSIRSAEPRGTRASSDSDQGGSGRDREIEPPGESRRARPSMA